MDHTEKAVAIFEKYAEEYQEKFMNYQAYTGTYERFERLITAQHTRVLDVGCGPGNITRFLLDRHPQCQVYGVDLSPRMIDLAAQNNPGHRFEVMDTRDIGKITEKFDVIICGFCLPYLTTNEAKTCIEDIGRLINPGGLLYISTIQGETSASGFLEHENGDGVLVNYFDTEFLQAELRANGFSILESFNQEYFSDDEQQAIDLFIFAVSL